MYRYAVDTATGFIRYGGCAPYDIDPATLSLGQARIEWSQAVDPLFTRWDGTTMVPMTADEQRAYRQQVLGQLRTLSKVAMLKLLTPTEYGAMFAVSDPVLAQGVALFSAASAIDLLDPVVTQLLDYCVTVGALTHARRDALWAAMQAAAV
jgi:hypothetical protein